MKTLNEYIKESILDDEDVLIRQAVELAQWCDTIKKFIKRDKFTECCKWLNDNDIYIAGDQKYCLWESSGDDLYYWFEGTLPFLFINKINTNEAKIEFMNDYDRDDYSDTDKLKVYDLTQNEYESIENKINKQFGAKKIKGNNNKIVRIFKL